MPATNPILIHVGRGDIYLNVPVPVVPPVILSVDGSPLNAPSAIAVGSTLDAARMIYRPTTFDIKTQQSTGNVGYVTIEEDLRLEFTPGELGYDTIKNTTISRLDQGIGISLGGIIFPQIMSVLIVAPRRAGGFIQAMIYQAVFSEDRTWEFRREGDTRPRVAARGQALTTRALGDQLGYFFPKNGPGLLD